MSNPPSVKPQTSSPAADCDLPSNPLDPSDHAILDTGRWLAAKEFMGIVTLDRDLNVVSSIGGLVAFIAAGRPLVDSLPPIIGLEAEILSLKEAPDTALELPAIALASDATAASKKLNLTFFWSPERNAPTALVHRSSAQTDIETELSRQIRARLMAEAAVSAKSKELARANSDLESFAAIVSHDLKAPLRHMRHLAEKARSENIDASSDTIEIILNQIEKQTSRMSSMLTALLDYSTFGRKYEAIEPVDTRALIADIAASLPRKNFEIRVEGDWPTITTLRAPFDLVLRNLVANALQHHDRDTGTIVATCEDQASVLAITVRDDGPGIDTRHHSVIFLPFRSLNEASTGMGLAAVHKAITGIRGTITVVSDPEKGRGTAFRFTWPKRLPI